MARLHNVDTYCVQKVFVYMYNKKKDSLLYYFPPVSFQKNFKINVMWTETLMQLWSVVIYNEFNTV